MIMQDDRSRKYIGMNDAARLAIVGASGETGYYSQLDVPRRLPIQNMGLRCSKLVNGI